MGVATHRTVVGVVVRHFLGLWLSFVNEKGGKMCVGGEEGDLRKEESRKQFPWGQKTQLYWRNQTYNAQHFSEEKRETAVNF